MPVMWVSRIPITPEYYRLHPSITDYTQYKPIVILDVIAGLLSYVLILNQPSMPVMWVSRIPIKPEYYRLHPSITDYTQYKPIVILDVIAGLLSYVLILNQPSMPVMWNTDYTRVLPITPEYYRLHPSITDYTRYKPIVILDVIAGLLSYVLILNQPSMPVMWVSRIPITPEYYRLHPSITDYTRYKPIVILDVIAGLLSYVLILNQPSMPVMWVSRIPITPEYYRLHPSITDYTRYKPIVILDVIAGLLSYVLILNQPSMPVMWSITDYTRYKPIVILDVIAGLLSYVLILNQPSMPVMWVSRVPITPEYYRLHPSITDYTRYKPIVILDVIAGLLSYVLILNQPSMPVMWPSMPVMWVSRIPITPEYYRLHPSFTDYTRYKPIVILDVIAGLLSYVLILNQPSMPVMWVQQVCIGFYHAGEVSYYSYMYSKIKDKAHYQKATGRVKASIMIGRFVSGMAGQSVVLLFDTTGYKYLVYLSILGMTAAVVWTCLLPPVQDSVYFHARQSPPSESTHLQSPPQHWTNVVTTIRTDFKTAFSQVEILKWSLWWILGMGGYILVITYNQILWSTLVKEDPENNRLMNGAMDAVFTITGAISTFTIGKVALDWNIFGELMLAIGTLLQGTLLILSHSTRSLKLAYLYYILFGCIHYTMLTIASSEIAKHLKRESFALVFGFNKFIALLSVSLFTLFIVQIENTPTRTLYFIFGVYFLSIGVTYFLAVLYRSKRVLRSLF
ncbi:hypothetical protein M8J76_004643 [Diaphorina citri]|nr:hypothetical protein M8J76_004643 [Diaphorina citri]